MASAAGRPASSRTSRRPSARGHQGRHPGHRQPPRPQLRAAQQHPRPDLHRPDRRRPRSCATALQADQRRRRRADAHRLHREPEERRSGQERRHQPGGARSPGWTRSSAVTATPNPASRPASGAYKYLPTIVAGPDGKPGDHQPGLPLQQHAGRGRPRPARRRPAAGMRSSRRAGQYLAVAMTSTAEDPAIKAIVDPYVAAAERLQQHGHRPDDGPDRCAEGLHRRRPTAPTCRPTPSVCELAQARHRRRLPPLRRHDQPKPWRQRPRRPTRSR